jgi:hypothetical protein
MASVEAYRDLVVARAAGGCEYCRLLEVATGVPFHIDHVIPRPLGGKTTLANLALSCPGCSLSKRDRRTGRDMAGNEQSLFNPREYEPWSLGWHMHFALERSSARIIAQSAIGEATIRALNMNSKQRVFARKLQIRFGLLA